MDPVNFRSFKRKLSVYRKSFRNFLNKTGKKSPRGVNLLTPVIEKEVWKEVDCLSCANCCKQMTPTFSKRDINRISAHLGQTPKEFYKKWLKKERNGDIVNKIQPCQFLNLKDNKCSIYEVRPDDCSGFPHLSKKSWKDYTHIHKQNIDYCPATYKLVEKMMERIKV